MGAGPNEPGGAEEFADHLIGGVCPAGARAPLSKSRPLLFDGPKASEILTGKWRFIIHS